MKKRLWIILLLYLISATFLPAARSLPEQSEKEIIINLVRPSEGETFYAGPSSLLYNIPIHGWVKSSLYAPEEIKVILEVYQDSKLKATQEKYADAEGNYEFYATVNPEGSTENFPATEADCGSYCHYLTELVLPAGHITLSLTVIDPAGNQDRIERHCIVDRSRYAKIPVQIVIKGSQLSDTALESIPVTATTRLYSWRNRTFSASTDVHGKAELRIEALAEAPTKYWVNVEPSIVNGVLYYSEEPVEVVLSPRAISGPAIALEVNSTTGTIGGYIEGMDQSDAPPGRVLVVRRTNGSYYSERISQQGRFLFDGIPIDEYLVFPSLDTWDPAFLFLPEAELINLRESQTASIIFEITELGGYNLQGEVRDENGQLLPFASISTDDQRTTQRVAIESSSYNISGIPDQQATFYVSSPGFYSEAFTLNLSNSQMNSMDLVLARQPDTIVLPWGIGEIIVPPESILEWDENWIGFRQGWLWGNNQQSSEFRVQLEEAEIVLNQGRYAIESLPNKGSWFYQFEGESTIYPADGSKSITIIAGEMIALFQNGPLDPILMDQAVISALQSEGYNSPSPVWKPTFSAQLSDRFEQLGVGSAQIITLFTYGFIFLAVIVIPFRAIYTWAKRRKK